MNRLTYPLSRTNRANVAHGTLDGVDASAALAMPGVRDVVLAKDIPGDKILAAFAHDEPVFAIDTVQSATFARGGRLDKLRVPLHIGRGILDAVLARDVEAATSILTEHILRTLEAVRQIPSDVLS